MYNLNELSTYGNGRVVLNRYHYSGGLKNQPIMQFCESNGIELEFIQVLWEAFQSNSVPDVDRLIRFDASMILEYLEKTHAYYLDKLIPEIELNIFRFSQLLGGKHPVVETLMNRFYVYKQDLVAHIEVEEKLCFTYVKQLLVNGVSTMDYTIDQFVNEHEHKEDQLGDLLRFMRMNILESDVLSYKMILSKLELLRHDLFIHASVEDEVLVPTVRQMERR
tara:strand:+ start:3167 stop:3829 length:663 start_codon:yes stop_codon:yes gene_type:complete